MYTDKELLRSGTGDYHTYRIPAVVTGPDNAMYLFCEGRVGSASDFDSVHMLLLTSRDGGDTWSEPAIVWREGEPEDMVTIGNPCPVYDGDTGDIHLLFTRNNERVFATKSTDLGKTWDEPVEISAQVSLPSWKRYWTGPGHGIQLRHERRRGRLIFPSYHIQSNPNGIDSINSHVVYSDDHGETWKASGSTWIDPGFERQQLTFTSSWWPQGFTWMGCECIAAELPDGRIYLSVRNQVGYRESRAYSWSTDCGESWSSLGLHPEIRDPQCQGAVIGLPADADSARTPTFLYTGITKGLRRNGEKRSGLTLFVSADECGSWSATRILHDGPAAYSDLAAGGDGTVCCFYEAGEEGPYETIRLARFDGEWAAGDR